MEDKLIIAKLKEIIELSSREPEKSDELRLHELYKSEMKRLQSELSQLESEPVKEAQESRDGVLREEPEKVFQCNSCGNLWNFKNNFCPECKHPNFTTFYSSLPIDKSLKEEMIRFAQQFYSDEETCIHNVDEYLTFRNSIKNEG
jgi:hypothetical protein